MQGLGGKSVVARIGGEAELFVGFHRVHAAVLQFVGAQLVHQADAAALLRQVEQNAGRRIRDLAQRQLELRSAIAALGRQCIARKALRMDAHKGGAPANFSADQSDRAFLLRFSFDAENLKRTEARGQFCARDDSDCTFRWLRGRAACAHTITFFSDYFAEHKGLVLYQATVNVAPTFRLAFWESRKCAPEGGRYIRHKRIAALNTPSMRSFTSARRLANVAAAGTRDEIAHIRRGFAAHAASACGRGGIDLRMARALGDLSQSAVYRTPRLRPKIEVDAVRNAALGVWRVSANRRPAISRCGLDAGGVVPPGIAWRARRRSARRIDYQFACVPASRVAVHDGCGGGRACRRIDSSDSAEHRRNLAAGSVYVSEHAAVARARHTSQKGYMGNVAARLDYCA